MHETIFPILERSRMQENLPGPKEQGSISQQGKTVSPELKERMSEVANFIIDRVIAEHQQEHGVPSF